LLTTSQAYKRTHNKNPRRGLEHLLAGQEQFSTMITTKITCEFGNYIIDTLHYVGEIKESNSQYYGQQLRSRLSGLDQITEYLSNLKPLLDEVSDSWGKALYVGKYPAYSDQVERWVLTPAETLRGLCEEFLQTAQTDPQRENLILLKGRIELLKIAVNELIMRVSFELFHADQEQQLQTPQTSTTPANVFALVSEAKTSKEKDVPKPKTKRINTRARDLHSALYQKYDTYIGRKFTPSAALNALVHDFRLEYCTTNPANRKKTIQSILRKRNNKE
jgi:hypothetical protein